MRGRHPSAHACMNARASMRDAGACQRVGFSHVVPAVVHLCMHGRPGEGRAVSRHERAQGAARAPRQPHQPPGCEATVVCVVWVQRGWREGAGSHLSRRWHANSLQHSKNLGGMSTAAPAGMQAADYHSALRQGPGPRSQVLNLGS